MRPPCRNLERSRVGRFAGIGSLVAGMALLPSAGLAAPTFSFEIEAKANLRDSEDVRFVAPFGAPGSFVLTTVDPGTSAELSTVTFRLGARWGAAWEAFAKVDAIDLHDRNPTSSDREVDLDEAWVRYGREALPGEVPDEPGWYLKAGKMGRFERQDDRHLESYGLVSTAFNRFEDQGLELGVDLGRHVYLKASYTQGNPVFFRDPNALAGDQGSPDWMRGEPELGGGIAILYDAEVEGLGFGDEPEVALGAGLRFGDASGRHGVDLLVFGSRRDLADRVDLHGTAYGGDLDFLRGPDDAFSYPLKGREKEEAGANLWIYRGPFTAFAQLVDQEIAGLGRTGAEVELAWRFELPLVWAVANRQVFTFVQPAVRYSQLDNDFVAPRPTPAPSFDWDWDKWDLGLRVGLVRGLELTVEHARNRFVLRNGREASNDETLVTLDWRYRKSGSR